MLQKVGLLTRPELRAILRGLDAIAEDIEAGRFRWRADLEDVHMNIEAELTRRAPAGAKLHTGRSRNDQIALDMRLWLRDEIALLLKEAGLLQRALVELAEKNEEVLIPGYTHLQRAQPVYLAHHLLAYVEMADRDRERRRDIFTRDEHGRPPGWDRGKKKGWGDCDVPPGQAKKQGCDSFHHDSRHTVHTTTSHPAIVRRPRAEAHAHVGVDAKAH